ncbi:uncharacterized protein KIAA1755 homolog isoform X2 [Hirundo rustica]|uniref:uncharacterized protein KIAA1755 homolog isoform X2 n=1 Tax=Hirundo rustica TaxID=43150 RepID=UPI001A942E18|nr:uncharacterized protein KIAA1755 homolog isoform X2 [Hirundo rustica]
MDAGSLDAAVQSALQALYPPFEATAPTVLGQVFRLLETSYQGDGLCCLLQFLIPAKRLFERLRQAACAPYFNRIFLHEGWPLCLHEKVVVHLAPLNPLLLRPGDFYLQAEPCEEHTARVTIKHLSLDLRSVEETPVPEATHALLFTNAWLEEVNGSWAGAPLHTCLVATENGVTPLPWSRIATPEFTDKPGAGAESAPAGARREPAPAPEPAAPGTAVSHGPTPYSNTVSTIPGCKATSRKSSQGRYPGLIKVEQAGLRKKPAMLAVPSLSEIISQNLEGEYVDLLEQSREDMEVLSRSLLPTCPPGRRWVAAEDMVSWADGEPGADARPCGGALNSEESPCSPCMGRKLSQEPGPHGPKCRQRDSYMAALQNPGTRLGAAPEDERVTSQHEGAWKKMSAIYSPRMGRARAAGKGTNAATAAAMEERSLESASCKNGPSVPSTGTGGREPPAWQDLHAGLLRSGIICLPGSSDRLGRALLLVTTSGSAWRAAWCSAAELARLILCLCSLPRQEVKNGERREAKDVGLTVVVDARKQPPSPVLFSALRSVQSVSPGCIHSMLLLAEKEPVSHRERLSGVQVETLTSLKALGRHVDSSQLPPELDGAFPYCHGEWVQFFQKLQPFTASLKWALELLQRCIQALRNTDALAGTQDAAAGIRRHQELMQKVLSDPQLVRVQREGGFLLARLRREAARLCASDHIRTGMELAEGLYSQLEEELHSLVSQSNSCLEHLEFLRKVRELETEFGKLGSWLDGEAAARLQEMGTEDWSPDSSQGSTEHFKEFLAQATARYQHGLTLCQEAAEVRDATFPEADAFQVAAALFQTKLMTFSKQLERRQAERELLQEFVRYSNKVAGLKLDCRQCSARAQRGEGQALRCLQRSFQKLSVEFALEKLQEMKAQVRRMQSSQGLAAWTEAQHRYRETRQILEEMLAELQEAWGARADGQGDSSSPESAAPHTEVPVCKAAPSPEPAVLGGRGLAEQPEASAEGPEQPQGPGQSQPSTTPGSTLGVERSSLQPRCRLGPQGAHTSHHHISADTPHPKAKSKGSLGAPGQLSQERSQPPRRRPFTLPPWTRFPGADPARPDAVPQGTASDPSTPGAPAGPRPEAAQYFQISSQSSFSSEDSDSQNSMEEGPAASLALPRDVQSPRPPCPSEKTHQIIYLENHHTESSAKANAK